MEFNLSLYQLYALREICQRALQDENQHLKVSDEDVVRLRWSLLNPIFLLHGCADHNEVWFRDEPTLLGLLDNVEDTISEEEKRKKILDEQVHAAKWSWLSYIVAIISALSAFVSAIAAVIAICYR